MKHYFRNIGRILSLIDARESQHRSNWKRSRDSTKDQRLKIAPHPSFHEFWNQGIQINISEGEVDGRNGIARKGSRTLATGKNKPKFGGKASLAPSMGSFFKVQERIFTQNAIFNPKQIENACLVAAETRAANGHSATFYLQKKVCRPHPNHRAGNLRALPLIPLSTQFIFPYPFRSPFGMWNAQQIYLAALVVGLYALSCSAAVGGGAGYGLLLDGSLWLRFYA
jgi:hypothetical protein